LLGLSFSLLTYATMQVDQHVETVKLCCVQHEEVLLARQLARKGLRPTKVTLNGSGKDSSAMAALLATAHNHRLFECVRSLTLVGTLSEEMLQVSTAFSSLHTPHTLQVRRQVNLAVCTLSEP
jgi:hypothetical protein